MQNAGVVCGRVVRRGQGRWEQATKAARGLVCLPGISSSRCSAAWGSRRTRLEASNPAVWWRYSGNFPLQKGTK